MTRDWFTPEAGEEEVWSGSPRLSTALPSVAIGLALLAGVAYAAWAVTSWAMVGVPVALAIPVAGYLQVRNTEFVVTDRAVYAKTGVVGRSVVESSLTNVQNTQFSQDLLGSVFGYGTVTVEIAGGDDIAFRRIENPADVRRLVDQSSGDAIPGSVDQWRAVLAEVRALREAVES
ncbi:PH domain-containing protein [Halorarius halobius]|uniref:PH domain-containing protein n=1 Tax=Halorarius halobius TaxID=2962671 RepID=UPI0020CFA7F1|nr:PH domain-containing protein [Halorarius halobius]